MAIRRLLFVICLSALCLAGSSLNAEAGATTPAPKCSARITHVAGTQLAVPGSPLDGARIDHRQGEVDYYVEQPFFSIDAAPADIRRNYAKYASDFLRAHLAEWDYAYYDGTNLVITTITRSVPDALAALAADGIEGNIRVTSDRTPEVALQAAADVVAADLDAGRYPSVTGYDVDQVSETLFVGLDSNNHEDRARLNCLGVPVVAYAQTASVVARPPAGIITEDPFGFLDVRLDPFMPSGVSEFAGIDPYTSSQFGIVGSTGGLA